jgi:hypothetical protein
MDLRGQSGYRQATASRTHLTSGTFGLPPLMIPPKQSGAESGAEPPPAISLPEISSASSSHGLTRSGVTIFSFLYTPLAVPGSKGELRDSLINGSFAPVSVAQPKLALSGKQTSGRRWLFDHHG